MTAAYLAGPMSGIEDYNTPLFDHVAEQLRAKGYEVLNPAELTREMYGSLDNFKAATTTPEEYADERQRLLTYELNWICKNAKILYLLPGWGKSSGAVAERSAALALGIKVVDVPDEMLLRSPLKEKANA